MQSNVPSSPLATPRLRLAATVLTFATLIFAAACGGLEDRYQPSPRAVTFAGQQWEIRQGPSPGGAGRNHWGATAESIVEDEDGIVLRLVRRDELWLAAELRAPLPRGAARVEFDVAVEGGEVAENVVLGLFVYSDDEHEADIECTRWGDSQALPWQAALHTHEGHSVRRFALGEGSESTHSIAWARRVVTWTSDSGAVHEWHEERLGLGRRLGVRFVHINLWLDRGRPPGIGTTEVRVYDVRIYDRAGRRLNE